MYRQFDADEFAKINWDSRTFFWLQLAILCLVGRHLAYSYRIHLLSDKFFSFWKSMKMIVLWEFSTAVSPMSVGGAVVALFVLAQEKYPAGKTAALVVYTIVLDSIFFLVSLPLLYFVFGPKVIRPEFTDFASLDQYGYGFFIAYVIILIYGGILAYGLFVKPSMVASILKWLTSFRLTARLRPKANQMANELTEASATYKSRPVWFHAKSMMATIVAWTFRLFPVRAVLLAVLVVWTISDLGANRCLSK